MLLRHTHTDPTCVPPAAYFDPFKLYLEESELLQLALRHCSAKNSVVAGVGEKEGVVIKLKVILLLCAMVPSLNISPLQG